MLAVRSHPEVSVLFCSFTIAMTKPICELKSVLDRTILQALGRHLDPKSLKEGGQKEKKEKKRKRRERN
jgi:hypothetical protein